MKSLITHLSIGLLAMTTGILIGLSQSHEEIPRVSEPNELWVRTFLPADQNETATSAPTRSALDPPELTVLQNQVARLKQALAEKDRLLARHRLGRELAHWVPAHVTDKAAHALSEIDLSNFFTEDLSPAKTMKGQALWACLEEENRLRASLPKLDKPAQEEALKEFAQFCRRHRMPEDCVVRGVDALKRALQVHPLFSQKDPKRPK